MRKWWSSTMQLPHEGRRRAVVLGEGMEQVGVGVGAELRHRRRAKQPADNGVDRPVGGGEGEAAAVHEHDRRAVEQPLQPRRPRRQRKHEAERQRRARIVRAQRGARVDQIVEHVGRKVLGVLEDDDERGLGDLGLLRRRQRARRAANFGRGARPSARRHTPGDEIGVPGEHAEVEAAAGGGARGGADE